MLKLNAQDEVNPHVKDISEVKHALCNIDWNFTSKTRVYEGMSPFDCRKHHWFPATFRPEIPFTLIEILTKPGATVYDPFGGIGTTYFQALLLNRKPYMTEICRVAVEFAKSLLVLFNPQLQLKEVQNRIESIIANFDPRINYEEKIDSSMSILIDQLRPWYHKDTFNQLVYLFLQEHNCNDKSTKAAMRILISAILNKASSQDRGWGCIADNVLPKQHQIKYKNALDLFHRRLKRLIKDISSHLQNTTKDYCKIYNCLLQEETIFHADVLRDEVIRDDSIDLVVTSPSYPGMTDYVKSQRLSYYWLGVPLSSENRDLIGEIGARHKRHRKDLLTQYLQDMTKFSEILSRKVKVGGYVCFVLAEFGRDKPERKAVIEKFVQNLQKFFEKEMEFTRVIPPIRRSHNIKWATLDQEKIIIFRK